MVDRLPVLCVRSGQRRRELWLAQVLLRMPAAEESLADVWRASFCQNRVGLSAKCCVNQRWQLQAPALRKADRAPHGNRPYSDQTVPGSRPGPLSKAEADWKNAKPRLAQRRCGERRRDKRSRLKQLQPLSHSRLE